MNSTTFQPLVEDWQSEQLQRAPPSTALARAHLQSTSTTNVPAYVPLFSQLLGR